MLRTSMATFCFFTIKSYNATSVSLSALSGDVVVIGLRGGDRQHLSQRQDLARHHHHHHHPGELRHHRNHNPPLSHNIHSSQSTGDDIQQQFYNAQDSIVKQLCPDDGNAQRPILQVAARFLAGTVAFYTAAFSLQYAQHKLLRISTGTKPGIIPVGCGIITVALGSWVGHLAGVGVVASSSSTSNLSSASLLPSPFFVQRGIISTSGFEDGIESIRNALRQLPETAGSGFKCAREMMRPMMFGLSDKNGNSDRERKERREAWMHTARICILGVLAYKTIFRSHFASLSPSSYTARGSFARIGLPAPPNFNYATPLQRAQLERIGRWWGCHTCGSRRIFSNSGKGALFGGGSSTTTLPKFHGDHIPPVSVAKQINNQWHRRALGWKVKQRFYPQCRICSNKQGGLLSRAVNAGHRNLHAVGGGEESFFHGRRLRIGHLTGGVVAVLSIGSTTADGHGYEAALVKASRERMLSFQKWFEDVGRNIHARFVRA